MKTHEVFSKIETQNLPDTSAIIMPRHVGFIMDGNRRWAKQRGLSHIEGHRAGAETLRKITESLIEFGISHATFYAFSTENWNRPRTEINLLFSLINEFIDQSINQMIDNQVSIKIIGNREGLSKNVLKSIDLAENKTSIITKPKLEVNIAFNYGGREEISQALKKIAVKISNGELKTDELDEKIISEHMYAPHVPDPDLIIRTSGEHRISNFLIWQSVYSEFISVADYWPDFDHAKMLSAVSEYSERKRRFGK